MVDARELRAIVEQVVAAVKPIVRDANITEDDLHSAALFLNEVGRAGVFPSMLDIAFAMTISDREHAVRGATRHSLEGPEYTPGAPFRPDGSIIEKDVAPDVTQLVLTGHVIDTKTGEGIAGAEIDVWNADENGDYDEEGFHLRGVVRTDENGEYLIRTVLPKDYAEHQNDPIGDLLGLMGRSSFRPAHIHLKILVEGLLVLTTQVYRWDSPYLADDYVVDAVSDELVFRFERTHDEHGSVARGVYDFHVSTTNESAPR